MKTLLINSVGRPIKEKKIENSAGRLVVNLPASLPSSKKKRKNFPDQLSVCVCFFCFCFDRRNLRSTRRRPRPCLTPLQMRTSWSSTGSTSKQPLVMSTLVCMPFFFNLLLLRCYKISNFTHMLSCLSCCNVQRFSWWLNTEKHYFTGSRLVFLMVCLIMSWIPCLMCGVKEFGEQCALVLAFTKVHIHVLQCTTDSMLTAGVVAGSYGSWRKTRTRALAE